MSLESKIDALKASIDALTLALEHNSGFVTGAFAASTAQAPVVQAQFETPAAAAPDVEAAKNACRNALGAAAQRLGSADKVVALLAQYIRPGSQPAGTPPNIEHVEPQFFAQLTAAAQALQ